MFATPAEALALHKVQEDRAPKNTFSVPRSLGQQESVRPVRNRDLVILRYDAVRGRAVPLSLTDDHPLGVPLDPALERVEGI
jgi:hypothetical protein